MTYNAMKHYGTKHNARCFVSVNFAKLRRPVRVARHKRLPIYVQSFIENRMCKRITYNITVKLNIPHKLRV